MKNELSLTANKLKFIAASAMLFDHAAAVFVPHGTPLGMILRIPGRISAPIMCFMIAEGYGKTRDVKKYIARLLVFAAVSHVPYNLCFGYSLSPLEATSVMWSLALGLIALTAVKSESVHEYLKLPILCLCCLLSFTADWNYVAVLWIVMFGVFHGDFRRQAIGFCVIGAVFSLIPSFIRFGPSRIFMIGSLLALPLLGTYRGERGRNTGFYKWFFYFFYPLHLLALHLIDVLVS